MAAALGIRRGMARSRREHRAWPMVRLRVLVWCRRSRLDRELADGLAADTSAARALRAQQLTDRAARRGLARALRGLVSDAEDASTARISAVPICPRGVLPWSEGLLGLADRLEQPEPVNPCGVARLRLLLTDGTSPFYSPTPLRPLGDTVWWVADGLQPCPPHQWGCPVVMKLDPEHVAWTCRRCGAIALTDGPAVKPA